MEVRRCPGQDRSNWTPDDIFEVACPACGESVEFFKDDKRRRCAGCGDVIDNPKFGLGCAEWCSAADKCSLMRGIVTDKG